MKKLTAIIVWVLAALGIGGAAYALSRTATTPCVVPVTYISALQVDLTAGGSFPVTPAQLALFQKGGYDTLTKSYWFIVASVTAAVADLTNNGCAYRQNGALGVNYTVTQLRYTHIALDW